MQANDGGEFSGGFMFSVIRRKPFSHSWLTLFFLILIVTASSVSAKEHITIGLIPEMNVFAQMQRYQPLADHISKELDIEIKLTILSRYGNIIQRLQENKVDAAFLGSFTGALAISQLGVEPLARPVNLDGTSTYHGHIFVRKDSSIINIEDMQGKIMAFVERATTAGYIFPLAWLKRKGVSNHQNLFGESFFAGSHDATIDAVLKRHADIGAAKNTIFDYYMTQNSGAKEQLVILASSPPVPSNGLCVLPRVDTTLKLQLRDILLSLDKTAAGRAVLTKLRAIKFVKTGAVDYQPVMDMARDAGIKMESYQYENK